jgi:protein-disulfide isomerase
MSSPRLLFSAIVGAAMVLACEGQPDATKAPARASVRDSIRARRTARLMVMPDTLGARADTARILGAPTASVWVVVVSDFQCQPCRDFALDVLPSIRRDFVDRGRVRLAFMNLPLDQHFNARFAAHASLCAAVAGRFWPMHDSLFATQERWRRTDDPRPYFDSLAVAAGVPAHAQAGCTKRQPFLRLMNEDYERSRAAGATEVPTVFVGDVRLTGSALTSAALRAAVERATRR